MEECTKYLVKPANTAEAGGQGNFGHGQLCFVDQLFGEEDTPGLRHRHRRGAEVLIEQSPEMAFADAEAFRERFDAGFSVKRTIGNEGKGARNGIRRSAPGGEVGRSLRAATQAGTKPCFLCRCRRAEEAAVLGLRGTGGAHRAAVDTGGGNADEQQSVEARIAGL